MVDLGGWLELEPDDPNPFDGDPDEFDLGGVVPEDPDPDELDLGGVAPDDPDPDDPELEEGR